MSMSDGIAIVGIDCRYPGSDNLDEFWKNIVSRRQQFRQMPKERFNLDDYYSSDRNGIDKTYSKNAAVLNHYEFDRLKYKISKQMFEQTDLTHWLALDVADGALKDAGFEKGEGINKQKAMVVLGNTLTGEFSRANIMRLRWPYVCRVLDAVLREEGKSVSERELIIQKMEALYKEPFPATGSESLAGGLANTIAGRICNFYDFNGGGYTVDGACSSSLLSIVNACKALMLNDADVVLAGGVDLSIDPFEIIGFAKTGALAEHEMRVYDKRSQGFWPGEGCGIVVMMRESDAVKQNKRIYGVIRGWGISSDGEGGVTRPKIDTQKIAMERAYEKAGYSIQSVGYVEGHGTGTVVGDEVELSALVNALKASDNIERDFITHVGSVKNLIGHTKAAAGVAGLIKTLLTLDNRFIPPMMKTDSPSAVIEENDSLIGLPQEGIEWTSSQPMRVGVCSMGFGGINVHIALEENTKGRSTSENVSKVEAQSSLNALKTLSKSYQDIEGFPLSADNVDALKESLESVKKFAKGASRSELIDVSARLIKKQSDEDVLRHRVFVLAIKPEELANKIDRLLEHLNRSGRSLVDQENGIFYQQSTKPAKIGYLFPGQGAPAITQLGQIAERFPELNQLYKGVELDASKPMTDTANAQPLIALASLASIKVLEGLGVKAELALGHSLGELSALSWAGGIQESELVRLTQLRGKLMSETALSGGAMLAIQTSLLDVKALIENSKVCISCYNGSSDYVVSGSIVEIETIQQLATERGLPNTRLNVSNAFHSAYMQPVKKAFEAELNSFHFNPLVKPIVSTICEDAYQESGKITKRLAEQLTDPVLFYQAIVQAQEDVDLLIEMGPGKTLFKTAEKYCSKSIVSMDIGSQSLAGYMSVIGALFVHGHLSDLGFLLRHRYFKNIDLKKPHKVLVNPCETAPELGEEISEQLKETLNQSRSTNANIENNLTADSDAMENEKVGANYNDISNYIKQLIFAKTEIPASAMNDDDKILSDLHLNSLVLTEIVANIAKKFNKSHKTFSTSTVLATGDSTIAELTQAILDGEDDEGASENQKVGRDKLVDWNHVFQSHFVKKSKPGMIRGNRTTTDYQFYFDDEKTEIAEYVTEMKVVDPKLGNVVVYFVSEKTNNANVARLLESTSSALGLDVCHHYAIVNLSSEQSHESASILRSFFIENPSINCTYLTFDSESSVDAQSLLAEISITTGYSEIYYKNNTRHEKVWQMMDLLSENTIGRPDAETNSSQEIQTNLYQSLSAGDVLLATGGGQGITYESAIRMAQRYGLKLGIVGRSEPEKNEILKQNLSRLTELNIDYCYVSADVSEQGQVTVAIEKIQKALGTISAVLHGAGVNRPIKVSDISVENFESTYKIKVGGAENVLNALDLSRVKLFTSYGSIIAESGMHGNADYAFSNEKLAELTEELGRTHPHIKAQTIEWSVWSEVGMGENLNTIDNLRQMGIVPISLERGLQCLEEIIEHKTPISRYLVCGRYGEIRTIKFVSPHMSDNRGTRTVGRFTTDLTTVFPGIEAYSKVALARSSDIYFEHHIYRGQYIFPSVMAFEAMAQVASALHPVNKQVVISNARFIKPILLDGDAESHVVVYAFVNEHQKIQTSIRSAHHFDEVYFEATYDFKTALTDKSVDSQNVTDALSLDVEKDVYEKLLFHTGPFRRITDYFQIEGLGSLAKVDGATDRSWFSSSLSSELVLGDFGINDAIIHCHQASVPHHSLLPSGVERISFYRPCDTEPMYIKTQQREKTSSGLIVDVQLFNKRYEIVQEWAGLILTRVKGGDIASPWHETLLPAYIYHRVDDLNREQKTFSQKKISQSLSEINQSNPLRKMSLDMKPACLNREKFLSIVSDNYANSDVIDLKRQLAIYVDNLENSEILLADDRLSVFNTDIKQWALALVNANEQELDCYFIALN